MKSVLILAVISLSFSALANPTKFVVQKDLIVNQKISQTNPDSGHYLMVRFMDDGSTTDEVIEPSCLLYIYSEDAQLKIRALKK